MSECEFVYPIRWPDTKDIIYRLVSDRELEPGDKKLKDANRFIEIMDFRDRKLEEKFSTMPCGGGGIPDAYRFVNTDYALFFGVEYDEYDTTTLPPHYAGSVEIPAGSWFAQGRVTAACQKAGYFGAHVRVFSGGNVSDIAGIVNKDEETFYFSTTLSLQAVFTVAAPSTVGLFLTGQSFTHAATVNVNTWELTLIRVNPVTINRSVPPEE